MAIGARSVAAKLAVEAAVVGDGRDSVASHQRARVLLAVSLIVLCGALALGIELIPLQRSGIWAAIFVVVALSCVLTALLTRLEHLNSATAVLLGGLALALLVGPIATRDLGTTPFWLGPLWAISLIIVPRSRTRWVVAGGVVLFAAMLIAAPPGTFETPGYADLLIAGSLVSLVTAGVAAYGLWERQRSLNAAVQMSTIADELLIEREAVRAQLEQRVADRSRALADVIADQEALIASLADMAVRDPRTGLFNGRHHKRHWSQIVEDSRSAGLPVSIIALDLDRFGRINREYSHAAGDRVLEEFASIIRRLIRPGDIPYRLGQGEEFIVLLPHTRCDEAVGVAERIRIACRKHTWLELPETERLTVSAGIAHREPDSAELWVEVLGRADAALSDAKEAGRDCVVVDRGRS